MICARCNGTEFDDTTKAESLEVAGMRFVADLPARHCLSCGALIVHGGSVNIFHSIAAAVLAEMKRDTPDALKYMRKTISRTPDDVARVLGVRPEQVREWERGTAMVDPRYPELLRMAIDCLRHGRPTSFDTKDPQRVVLRVPQQPLWSRDSIPAHPC